MEMTEPSDEELMEIEMSLSPSAEEVLIPAMSLEECDALVDNFVRKKPSLKSLRERLVEAEETTRQVYLNPKNWQRTRGIALIHEETQTCLGNFAEYVHLKVKDCRKLLREETPIAVDGVEYVSGTWWLPQAEKPEPAQVWHKRIPATVHLHLDQLKVHATAVPVIACLAYGALARCELTKETLFAQWEEEGKSGSVLLYLPKGTNVLEVMSRDTKIKLKELTG